jgi:hypothetical protein
MIFLHILGELYVGYRPNAAGSCISLKASSVLETAAANGSFKRLGGDDLHPASDQGTDA